MRKLMGKPGELLAIGTLIIVADDDAAVCSSLKFSLEVEGFAVRTHLAAVELLNDTELEHAGCLVIDQNMPGMNGLDLLAQVRARAIAAPAILITSHPSMMLRERAAKAGVLIVEKPLLGTTLLDRIRDLSSHRNGKRPN